MGRHVDPKKERGGKENVSNGNMDMEGLIWEGRVRN